jgi:hypothetical protein
MNFIIYSHQFYMGVGGVKVLHKLCHTLNVKGHNAVLFPIQNGSPYYTVYGEYNTPIITQEQLDNINEYVVIYPENLRGEEINALNTKKFVRWLLNDPFEYLPTWNSNDEIIYFVDLYKLHKDPITKNLTKNTESNFDDNLCILEFHKNIFYNKNLPRKGSCFAYRKCPPESRKPIHPSDSIEIEWNDVGNLVQLSNLFNTTETFYCYDDATFLSIQAAMCGCEVIVVPFRFTKDEWLNNNVSVSKYGIAYGNSDTELYHAKSTLNKINEEIEIFEKRSDNQVNSFIKNCERIFN